MEWKVSGREIIRWRIDLWEPLERRLDMRDVEDSESARDRPNGLCRLRCEGGTARGEGDIYIGKD